MQSIGTATTRFPSLTALHQRNTVAAALQWNPSEKGQAPGSVNALSPRSANAPRESVEEGRDNAFPSNSRRFNAATLTHSARNSPNRQGALTGAERLSVVPDNDGKSESSNLLQRIRRNQVQPKYNTQHPPLGEMERGPTFPHHLNPKRGAMGVAVDEDRIYKLESEMATLAHLFRSVSDRVGATERRFESYIDKSDQRATLDLEISKRMQHSMKEWGLLQSRSTDELAQKMQSDDDARVRIERDLATLRESLRGLQLDLRELAVHGQRRTREDAEAHAAHLASQQALADDNFRAESRRRLEALSTDNDRLRHTLADLEAAHIALKTEVRTRAATSSGSVDTGAGAEVTRQHIELVRRGQVELANQLYDVQARLDEETAARAAAEKYAQDAVSALHHLIDSQRDDLRSEVGAKAAFLEAQLGLDKAQLQHRQEDITQECRGSGGTLREQLTALETSLCKKMDATRETQEVEMAGLRKLTFDKCSSMSDEISRHKAETRTQIGNLKGNIDTFHTRQVETTQSMREQVGKAIEGLQDIVRVEVEGRIGAERRAAESLREGVGLLTRQYELLEADTKRSLEALRISLFETRKEGANRAEKVSLYVDDAVRRADDAFTRVADALDSRFVDLENKQARLQRQLGSASRDLFSRQDSAFQRAVELMREAEERSQEALTAEKIRIDTLSSSLGAKLSEIQEGLHERVDGLNRVTASELHSLRRALLGEDDLAAVEDGGFGGQVSPLSISTASHKLQQMLRSHQRAKKRLEKSAEKIAEEGEEGAEKEEGEGENPKGAEEREEPGGATLDHAVSVFGLGAPDSPSSSTAGQEKVEQGGEGGGAPSEGRRLTSTEALETVGAPGVEMEDGRPARLLEKRRGSTPLALELLNLPGCKDTAARLRDIRRREEESKRAQLEGPVSGSKTLSDYAVLKLEAKEALEALRARNGLEDPAMGEVDPAVHFLGRYAKIAAFIEVQAEAQVRDALDQAARHFLSAMESGVGGLRSVVRDLLSRLDDGTQSAFLREFRDRIDASEKEAAKRRAQAIAALGVGPDVTDPFVREEEEEVAGDVQEGDGKEEEEEVEGDKGKGEEGEGEAAKKSDEEKGDDMLLLQYFDDKGGDEEEEPPKEKEKEEQEDEQNKEEGELNQEAKEKQEEKEKEPETFLGFAPGPPEKNEKEEEGQGEGEENKEENEAVAEVADAFFGPSAEEEGESPADGHDKQKGEDEKNSGENETKEEKEEEAKEKEEELEAAFFGASPEPSPDERKEEEEEGKEDEKENEENADKKDSSPEEEGNTGKEETEDTPGEDEVAQADAAAAGEGGDAGASPDGVAPTAFGLGGPDPGGEGEVGGGGEEGGAEEKKPSDGDGEGEGAGSDETPATGGGEGNE
uniref:Uncharacterized protein n=1 Tax=Chromera velia CCMP2878 TaxID=1169474 RepID=A0A0G4GL58_9ALVE|eukprot:Cvel_22404.t1-p1 / transcript=Cvel_22404.t1 / gene=Cvel_22404 / organism=Chromera_velia_CCMP2878 / gene_product=hypothetical protein / transcript_product=hypothetical protein / location=Cvel_scaffold2198:5878-11972(+) / protein_length=1379 / sequence_SO=supercontig / SO=protein_coding / is_pseudo=false